MSYSSHTDHMHSIKGAQPVRGWPHTALYDTRHAVLCCATRYEVRTEETRLETRYATTWNAHAAGTGRLAACGVTLYHVSSPPMRKKGLAWFLILTYPHAHTYAYMYLVFGVWSIPLVENRWGRVSAGAQKGRKARSTRRMAQHDAGVVRSLTSGVE